MRHLIQTKREQGGFFVNEGLKEALY